MKSVIVGTAGHIDHGKTALVKALTGIDADRLEEEKRRGITIDLGFAHLELPGADLRLGFIDVPGHERFVRNMLAGVGGIDLVLLVIAADESVKPQTREHFDICRLLNLRQGIIVLTKADLVEPETLEVVQREIEEAVRDSFLEGAPLIPVSALTGQGLDRLKVELASLAATVPSRDAEAPFRLPIDRVFSMKGFGTVVTGTLLSGGIRKETEVELFPSGQRLRVRGIQVHNAPAGEALAGQRTALNLAGVGTEELARGMTLMPPGRYRVTRRADAQITLLPGARPLRNHVRVHFHCHTTETVAEVVLLGAAELRPGQTAWAQLRFSQPLLLLPGDRFILRQFSPVVTIGGGMVLDAAPLPGKPRAERAGFLQTLSTGAPAQVLTARVERRGHHGLSLAGVVAETGWTEALVERALQDEITAQRLLRFGNVLVTIAAFAERKQLAVQRVSEFHSRHPLVPGMSKEELREKLDLDPELFSGLMDVLARDKQLQVSGEIVHQVGRGVVMRDEEAESKRRIEEAFAAAGLKVPALKEVLAGLKVDRARAQQIVTLLLRERILIKLADDLVFHREALEKLRQLLVDYKKTSAHIDVARFKDLAGVSRKYAIPLLEYLDRERVTRRVGEAREILPQNPESRS